MTISHLSTRELSERWNISRRTLDRWRWAGEGPPFLKLGGRVVYRLADIEVFEAASLHTRTDERAAATAGVHPFTPKQGKRPDPVTAVAAAGSLHPKRLANR
jgi:predicted DNA-binding transcriptional regulator AlpA